MRRVQIFMDEGVLAEIDGRVGRGSRSEFIRNAVSGVLDRGSSVVEQRSPKPRVGGSTPSPGAISPKAKVLLEYVRKRQQVSRNQARRDLAWTDGDLLPATLELRKAGLIGTDPQEIWVK